MRCSRGRDGSDLASRGYAPGGRVRVALARAVPVHPAGTSSCGATDLLGFVRQHSCVTGASAVTAVTAAACDACRARLSSQSGIATSQQCTGCALLH
jgi:hypothetical protein